MYSIAGGVRFFKARSCTGCPHDNASMERYYSTLRTVLIYYYRLEIAGKLDYAVLELLAICTIRYSHTLITDI